MNIDLRCGNELTPQQFAQVRLRTIFDCHKWDPQLEDKATLAPFPLLLSPDEWSRLATMAEALARETLAVEEELIHRPDLHRQLGLPWRIRRALACISRDGPPRGAARVMRFDFHPTTEGWRISEVNSDVPGGFVEAAGFTCCMMKLTKVGSMMGNPAEAWAAAIQRRVGSNGVVALVHATAYADDRQVMLFLQDHLRRIGLQTYLISPAQLRWEEGHAHLNCDWARGSIDLLLRFFPAEWLPQLPRSTGWQNFFVGSNTWQANPATAILTQSKRWPLVWNELQTAVPMWRKLLPATCPPTARTMRQNHEAEWVLKPALGRVGEAIGMTGVTATSTWKTIRQSLWWSPQTWLAQRRFDALPIESPVGPCFPCLGVYTIDGVASGIYGRIALRPLIDSQAWDVAVLCSENPVASRSHVA